MPLSSVVRLFQVAAVVALAFFSASASAADFTVTTPGGQFSYVINGTSGNPTITLVRGRTYTFSVSATSNHPFEILTGDFSGTPPGVSGNNTSSGTITFAVPLNAQDCAYICSLHGFGGTIQMVDPPTPPTVKLVGLQLGTNFVLTATQITTNGFSFIPEANTNVSVNQWFALTVKSNRFANGTNEIFCGAPVATNAFIRIRIQ